MPRLITGSLEEYEAALMDLTNTPESLRALRRRLESAAPSSPLFDTPAFVRDLEGAYRRMAAGAADGAAGEAGMS
jgi:predicted O-linked N-acetylglucosamine transferase (SPINDLY family)